MSSAIDTPEFETDRRQFYGIDGAFLHVRLRPTFEKALNQNFITAEEFARPSEDGRALDRMVVTADVATGMLDDATVLNGDPAVLGAQLFRQIRQDPDYAGLLDDTLEQMVATPSNPPHTKQSAKQFLINELFAAVVIEKQTQLKVLADGELYYQQEIAQDPERIRPFAPDKAAVEEVSARLAASGEPVEFHGTFQGGYAVGSTEGGKANPPLIGTDFLMDCVAVVVHGVDPSDPSKQTAVIGHIDIGTDPQQAVQDMLAQVPAGYRIDATLLGGPQNENPYMNTQVLNALRTNDRIGDIRQDTSAATTVLVDVQTGTILHHAGQENEGSAERIEDGEFPFRVKQGGFPTNTAENLDHDRHQFREFVERGVDQTTPIHPWMPLVNAWDAKDQSQRDESSLSGLIEQANSDNLLTTQEQKDILERARAVFQVNDIKLDASQDSYYLKLMHGELELFSIGRSSNLKIEGDDTGTPGR